MSPFAGTLAERLGALARARRANRPAEDGRGAWGVGGAATSVTRERTTARLDLEEVLPGGTWQSAHGAVFVHERLRTAIERPHPRWGRLGNPPPEEEDLVALRTLGLGAALFLDLETGGFGSSPVFLAGTMHWNGADFVVRQYLARDYGEERGLLAAVAEAARGFEFLVTFNGKSYDAPFLKSRAIVNAVPFALPKHHLDLLHPSRRRWKWTLRDCRLQTLERHVCRRFRSGDVPSDVVPEIYHRYVRDGDPHALVPVLHHNMLDVITMAEILQALCAPSDPFAATFAEDGLFRGWT